MIRTLPVHRLHLPDDSNHRVRRKTMKLLEKISNVCPVLKIQIQLHDTLHFYKTNKQNKTEKYSLYEATLTFQPEALHCLHKTNMFGGLFCLQNVGCRL